MGDQNSHSTLFHNRVILRKEGDEYLLYNRNTDQLLMLSQEGMTLLRTLATTKDISKVSDSQKAIISQAKSAGILNEQLQSKFSDNQINLDNVDSISMKNLRYLGDLTVSAWAIAAQAPGAR